MSGPRRRIAIIGGGPAGLATAWWLTHRPADRERFEVTVYERSWRVGGKGASGRGPSSRIHEHGIHLFGNWYQNTWEMLREVYGRDDLAEHFHAVHAVVVTREGEDGWEYATRAPIATPGEPWASVETARVRRDEQLVELARDAAKGGLFDPGFRPITARGARPPATSERDSRGPTEASAYMGPPERVTTPQDLALDSGGARVLGAVAEAVLDLLGNLPGETKFDWVRDNLLMLRAVQDGYAADRLAERGLAAVDDVDHVTWLRRHMEPDDAERILAGPLSRVIPHICFHAVSTDGDDPEAWSGEMSAASYLSFALRELLYRGAVGYFFRSSTGESVMLPVYRKLRERGVRFRFFHHVEELEVDGDEVAAIHARVLHRPYEDSIHVDGDDRYDPLLEIAGRDGEYPEVWPDAPLVDDPAEARRLVGESRWHNAQAAGDEVMLRRGEDFDDVVLATSLEPLRFIARDVVSRDGALLSAIAAMTTTATKHAQLWLDERPAGWEELWNGEDRWFATTFRDEYPAFVNLPELIEDEGWPSEVDAPRDVLWLSAALPDADIDDVPTEAEHERWLRVANADLDTVLPSLAEIGVRVFRELDADGDAVDARYVRVNIDPDERYVMSPPGTWSVRPHAWSSPLRNLVYAGDWIETGINIGCFEAAITSGKLAAHALNAYPPLEDVHGYADLRGEDWSYPDVAYKGAAVEPDPPHTR